MKYIKTKEGFEFWNLDGNGTVHIARMDVSRSVCGVEKLQDDAPFNRSHVIPKHKLCLKCLGRCDLYEEHVEEHGEFATLKEVGDLKEQLANALERNAELEEDASNLRALFEKAHRELDASLNCMTDDRDRLEAQLVDKIKQHVALQDQLIEKTKGANGLNWDLFRALGKNAALNTVIGVLSDTIENLGKEDVKPKHKAPELIFCLQTDSQWHMYCRPAEEPATLLPHKQKHQGIEYDRILDKSGQVWIGHWNDGLESIDIDEGVENA